MVARLVPFTAVAPASGLVSVRITSGGRDWDVTQVSTECSAAPVGATCFIRKNGSIISKMLPAGDVASGEPSIPLLVPDVMTVDWTGLTPGATCKVSVFANDGR